MRNGGIITLLIGVGTLAASLFLIARRGAPLLLDAILVVLFGLTAAIGLYDWKNVSQASDDASLFQIQAGWGLVVVTLLSFLGIVLSLPTLFEGLGKAISKPRHQMPDALMLRGRVHSKRGPWWLGALCLGL